MSTHTHCDFCNGEIPNELLVDFRDPEGNFWKAGDAIPGAPPSIVLP